MKDETEQPQEQIDPGKPGRDWLYAFERLVRDRDFLGGAKLFHDKCVYYGLADDCRPLDFSETWKTQLAFSFDMAQTKVIVEGNLLLACAPWVAQGLVHGSPQKLGRLTVALMKFSNNKLLAVHYHDSLKP